MKRQKNETIQMIEKESRKRKIKLKFIIKRQKLSKQKKNASYEKAKGMTRNSETTDVRTPDRAKYPVLQKFLADEFFRRTCI